MVVTKINLLKNRHTLSESEYQKELKIFRYSLIAVVIVAFVTVAIAGWHFFTLRQLSQIEERISQATQKLSGLTEANAKQVYLKSRLNLITKFLESRSTSRQALQRIFSINLPGVTVTAASFETDSIIRIQAVADNAVRLSELIDYLSRENNFFLQVYSRGITRLQDGKYQMEVQLTIPKG